MAEIRLHKDLLEPDPFPSLCAATGGPPGGRVKQRLAWNPPWVALLVVAGVIPFVIVYLITVKRATLEIPLSYRLIKRWRLGRWTIGGGLFVALVLLISAIVEGSAALFFTSVVGAIMAPVAGSIMTKLGSIRARLIDEHTVRIRNVDPSFARELARRVPVVIDGQNSYPPPPQMPPPPARPAASPG